MSSDLRYHIASLAAVFLALGIGILIGAAFMGAPVVNRQTALIQRLETNVGELRRETREARRNEEALRILLPGVVAGKLTGRRILVVQSGPYADAAEKAVEALRLAGAAEAYRVALPVEAWRRQAAAVGNGEGGGAASAEELSPVAEETIAAEARRLAPLLLSAANAEALEPYRDNGTLTGDAPEGIVRHVVLIGGDAAAAPLPKSASGGNGGAESPAIRLARRRDTALIEAWQEIGATVVGAEPADAGISMMITYQNADISTIDNIDHAAGQMALPFALLGEKAAYGFKPTAERILPESMETPRPSGLTDTPAGP